jgi:large subunit ribosomal protein L18
MDKAVAKRQGRIRRHKRVRKNVFGTAQKPRLCVYRSNEHIYAQLVDDSAGKTLVTASSIGKEGRAKVKDGGNASGAAEVGKLIAERAKKAGVEIVVFDRGGNQYHGRVKALADAAREAGLKF